MKKQAGASHSMHNAGAIMNDRNLLGPWIRRFLLEHMVAERNFSLNTQASYRDTLTLLLPFAGKLGDHAIDRMTVEDLSPAIVRRFLDHVELDRHCSGATRNLRLSAIHSLARFIGMHSPVHLSWCSEVRSIPFKKTIEPLVGYLDKPEMDALLAAPNRRTAMGARDYALLLFLYNTGARADEVAKLVVGHLRLAEPASVRILGKGNKMRVCPLWPTTSSVLTRLVTDRTMSDAVFLGRTNQPMTRFGIYRVVTQCAERASKSLATMKDKRISPHSVRHTTAVHLLRAGVDINTIRAWLGHVSLDTTHIYAEVDLEMKAKALASVDISGLPTASRRTTTLPSLMAFLKQL